MATEAAVEYKTAQYDVSAGVETDAIIPTGIVVVVACDAAAIETTGVANAANTMAAEEQWST